MKTFDTIRQEAADQGRHRLIYMSTPSSDLFLFVKIAEDLNGRFVATCAYEGDTLTVNGAHPDLYLHDGADDQAFIIAQFGFDWREHAPT